MMRGLLRLFGAKPKDKVTGTVVNVATPDYARSCARPRSPGRFKGRGGF